MSQRRTILKALLFAPLAFVLPRLVEAQNNPPSPAAKPSDKKAAGAALPPLGEQEPLAKAMKYVEDANKAEPVRADKKSFCNNCAKFNKCAPGDTACKPSKDKKATYQPCEVFVGKSVHTNGWCMSWTKA